jgi:endonuclease/exonuclease/phosphatase family metal-dependent hydrolase
MAQETLRVLTWNLFHGRSVPPAGRSLRDEFGAALAAWEWDVALLQEVPPWWPGFLAARTRAQQRTALTSRNWLPPLQRWLGDRFPDVMKSFGGGANAILSRTGIADHRTRLLRRCPERRVAHGVRLADGTWAVNLHATVHDPRRATGDITEARAAALEWSGGAPLVVGGDFNLREPRVPGFVHAAGAKVDHVFALGWEPAGPVELPERGRLSDHAPVAVVLRRQGTSAITAV